MQNELPAAFGAFIRKSTKWFRSKQHSWLTSALKKRKNRMFGEWRSLVAHLLWEQRVAGSNPVSPTNTKLTFLGF